MATHRPVIINELFGELVVPPEHQRWTVVYTKPRCEKRVADYAGKNLIQYYLPQLKTKRVYQRRKVVTTSPMFSGYIFMVLSLIERETIALSGLVVNFIRVVNQQELLDDLTRLCFATSKDVPMQKTLWLSKGLEVEITKGALKGMRGVVESHDKITEIRLQVEILRQAVMVKIEPENIKIIGNYEIEEVEE
jgi:transcription antitermination factor NusG